MKNNGITCLVQKNIQLKNIFYSVRIIKETKMLKRRFYDYGKNWQAIRLC